MKKAKEGIPKAGLSAFSETIEKKLCGKV